MADKTKPFATDAVVFDLDGVIVDSETLWDDARRALARDVGGRWSEQATTDMMGMSSVEWSRYMHDRLEVALEPSQISSRVAQRVIETYASGDVPLLPGAIDTVRAVARTRPTGLASSSNRSVIEAFLDATGTRECFAATVSSEEVARGKPAPDVYVEALRRLQAEPGRSLAVEDSSNGIRSAHTAGMTVVAVPNRHFPPTPDALALAAYVITSVAALPGLIADRE